MKIIITSAVTSLVVAVCVFLLIGVNQSGDNLGAVTRMPNVDLQAKSITATTTSTTATGTIYATSRSSTRGGWVILKDSDGAGCTFLAGLNGNISTGTVACQ